MTKKKEGAGILHRTLGQNLRSYHIPVQWARGLTNRYCNKILIKYGLDPSNKTLEEKRGLVISHQNELAASGLIKKWRSCKQLYDTFERRTRLCEAFVESVHDTIMRAKMCPPSEKKQRPVLLRLDSPSFVEPPSSIDSQRSLPRVPASVTPKSRKPAGAADTGAAGASPAITTAVDGTSATPSSSTAAVAIEKKKKHISASPRAAVTPAASAGVHKPTSKVAPTPTPTVGAGAGAGASTTPVTPGILKTPSRVAASATPVSVVKKVNTNNKGTTHKVQAVQAGHKKKPAAAVNVADPNQAANHASGRGGPPEPYDSDPSSLSEFESDSGDEQSTYNDAVQHGRDVETKSAEDGDALMTDAAGDHDDFLLDEPDVDNGDDDDIDASSSSSSSSSSSETEDWMHDQVQVQEQEQDEVQDEVQDGDRDQDQDQDQDQYMFEPSTPFEIYLSERLDTLQDLVMTLGEKLDNAYLALIKKNKVKAKDTEKVNRKKNIFNVSRLAQPARIAPIRDDAKVIKKKEEKNIDNIVNVNDYSKKNKNTKMKANKHRDEGARQRAAYL